MTVTSTNQLAELFAAGRYHDLIAAAQSAPASSDTSQVLGMVITGIGEDADDEDFSAYEYDEDEDGVPQSAPRL